MDSEEPFTEEEKDGRRQSDGMCDSDKGSSIASGSVTGTDPPLPPEPADSPTSAAYREFIREQRQHPENTYYLIRVYHEHSDELILLQRCLQDLVQGRLLHTMNVLQAPLHGQSLTRACFRLNC